MIYEQTVTLTIQYDPEVHNDPEEWSWNIILDVAPDEVTLENAGPVTVVEGDETPTVETEDLMGVEFIDPYLGRDDIVWQVNADCGDGQWQAEVVTADEEHDNDLGTCDLYTVDFIQMHRIER